MRLSRKARYAVTAMLDLALQPDQAPVTLAEISQRQGISLSYLEQIFAALRKQGLVEGIRGPGGGYCLSKSPAAITMAEIVATVDGPMVPHATHVPLAFSQKLWYSLSRRVRDFLDTITLADLIESGRWPSSPRPVERPSYVESRSVA